MIEYLKIAVPGLVALVVAAIALMGSLGMRQQALREAELIGKLHELGETQAEVRVRTILQNRIATWTFRRARYLRFLAGGLAPMSLTLATVQIVDLASEGASASSWWLWSIVALAIIATLLSWRASRTTPITTVTSSPGAGGDDLTS